MKLEELKKIAATRSPNLPFITLTMRFCEVCDKHIDELLAVVEAAKNYIQIFEFATIGTHNGVVFSPAKLIEAIEKLEAK